MKAHALARFEADLRARNAPRPPDLHGTRHNQFTRRVILESWIRHNLGELGPDGRRRWRSFKASQAERDRLALGRWQPWIAGSRADAAAVQSIAKFQAAAARRRRQP